MEITVKDDFNKEVKMSVDPEEKLSKLMTNFSEIFGIPIPCMAVIHKNNYLETSKSLKEQNVKNGDEIEVYFYR